MGHYVLLSIVFVTAMLVSGCGQTEFSSSGDGTSSKASVGDEASGDVHQLSDLIDNPDLAAKYPCHHNGKKVLVCHVPQGNPDNRHNICIGRPAVDAHLRLHDASSAAGDEDTLGPCPGQENVPAVDAD